MSAFPMIISILVLLAGMIFLYLKIIPKKYDGTFDNKLLQAVHDYFNFKELFIETVLKFIFTLLTVSFIALGIGSLFNTFIIMFRQLGYVFEGYYEFSRLVGNFFTGIFSSLLVMVIGPVFVRLCYEGIMMFILLVKNVIEINNKLKKSDVNKNINE